MVCQKRIRFQLGIILVHDPDENIEFAVVETFLHLAGRFVAELDLDIRPFFIEARQDLRETDLSPVGRDPELQGADAFFGDAGETVLEFMFLSEDADCDCVELFSCVGKGELWLPVKEWNAVVLFQTLDVLA